MAIDPIHFLANTKSTCPLLFPHSHTHQCEFLCLTWLVHLGRILVLRGWIWRARTATEFLLFRLYSPKSSHKYYPTLFLPFQRSPLQYQPPRVTLLSQLSFKLKLWHNFSLFDLLLLLHNFSLKIIDLCFFIQVFVLALFSRD